MGKKSSEKPRLYHSLFQSALFQSVAASTEVMAENQEHMAGTTAHF
jgi:hypothetical protein